MSSPCRCAAAITVRSIALASSRMVDNAGSIRLLLPVRFGWRAHPLPTIAVRSESASALTAVRADRKNAKRDRPITNQAQMTKRS